MNTPEQYRFSFNPESAEEPASSGEEIDIGPMKEEDDEDDKRGGSMRSLTPEERKRMQAITGYDRRHHRRPNRRNI